MPDPRNSAHGAIRCVETPPQNRSCRWLTVDCDETRGRSSHRPPANPKETRPTVAAQKKSTKTATAPTRSRFSRVSRRSANVPACTSAPPASAACTTWSGRSSTTRSTRRWPATPPRSTSRILEDGGVEVTDDGRGIPVAMHATGVPDRRRRHDPAARRRQVRRQSAYHGLRWSARRRRLGGQRAVHAGSRPTSAATATSGSRPTTARCPAPLQAGRGRRRRPAPRSGSGPTRHLRDHQLRLRDRRPPAAGDGLPQQGPDHRPDRRAGHRRGGRRRGGQRHRRGAEVRRGEGGRGQGARTRSSTAPSTTPAAWSTSSSTSTAPRPPIQQSIIDFAGKGAGHEVEVAMQWNAGYSESVHTFANTINTHEGGTHEEGFRSGADHAWSTSTPRTRSCSRRRTPTSPATTSARVWPRSSR